MGISVWRLRNGVDDTPVVEQPVQAEVVEPAMNYWVVDVLVEKWATTVCLVSPTTTASNAESQLLQAIAKAVGQVDNPPRQVTQLPVQPVVAFGGLGDSRVKRVCALDYTVSQILADATLKRPVWQVLQRFIARSSPFEDTQGNSTLPAG